jgi:very-short-patch-repair endonuclease
LDGIQHFKQVKNWANPEETRKRDKIKMQKANENGFSVIRILQRDVLANKYKWLRELQTNIDKIISEGQVQNVYMCKNNEYEIFIK